MENVTNEIKKQVDEDNADLRYYHEPEVDGEYDSSLETQLPREFRATWEENRYDDYGDVTLILYGRGAFPQELARKLASKIMRLDASHCQHGYDCCGNWYGRAATFERERDGWTKKWIIKRNIYQNV